MLIILILSYVFIPVLIIYLTGKNKIANRIGAIIIAYIFGLLLGHIGLIPSGSDHLYNLMVSGNKLSLEEVMKLKAQGLLSSNDVLLFRIRNIQDIFTTITIPLAIPLLLFSLDVRNWFKMAGKALLSMVLAVIAVLLVVSVGYLIFKGKIHDLWKISGMLVGLYTGGTPNLAALKMMLNVDPDTYIITHTYDTIVSVVYLFFLITIGKKVFRGFLLPYPNYYNNWVKISLFTESAYHGILQKKYFVPLLKALGLSLLIFTIAGGLSFLVPENLLMIVVILTITTLSILFSLIPSINKIEKTFELGIYFILVFSIVVASMADITKLVNISWQLFMYVTFAIFGSLLLHMLLARIFKVDADTVMVTSAALICSPPFVPMVAGAIHNKEVIVSGLTVGIMGYAIGNYLGILLAYFLH